MIDLLYRSAIRYCSLLLLLTGESSSTRPQNLNRAFCEQCGATNVAGAAPDHKLIAPALDLSASNPASNTTSLTSPITTLQKRTIGSPALLTATTWVQIPFADRTMVTP